MSERNQTFCPECKIKMERPPDLNQAAISSFTPMFFNNIDTKPVFISTKQELRNICKKKGFSSGALL